MLKRFTTADIWPDAVLLVVAASAIRFVAILLLALIMTNIIGDTIGG
jgi:hypothetical protein